jgi:hypothetical protein
MYHLTKWLQAKSEDADAQILVDAIEASLRAARSATSRRGGIGLTAMLGYLQAAQENILRLAPLWYVHSCMPSIVMQGRKALDPTDLQLTKLEEFTNKEKFTDDDRETIIACFSGANEQIRRNQTRLESFRNVIAASAGFLFFLVAVVAIISFLRPTLLPICFFTESGGVGVVVCPSATSPLIAVSGQPGPALPDVNDVAQRTVGVYDIMLVEFCGFLGAAMSAALAIRNVRGSSDPYSIPVALSLLKLPSGALTALVGIILIRAGLVPGIETLKSSAEIIAWALAFGFSQQLFTGVVDRQARSVLEQAGASLQQPVRTIEPS